MWGSLVPRARGSHLLLPLTCRRVSSLSKGAAASGRRLKGHRMPRSPPRWEQGQAGSGVVGAHAFLRARKRLADRTGRRMLLCFLTEVKRKAQKILAHSTLAYPILQMRKQEQEAGRPRPRSKRRRSVFLRPSVMKDSFYLFFLISYPWHTNTFVKKMNYWKNKIKSRAIEKPPVSHYWTQ